MAEDASIRATILIVDDEQENRALVDRTLREWPNVRTLVASSGAEALALLSSVTVDLLLVDQRMPEMKGVQLLKQVRHAGRRVTAIMLTAYPDDDGVQEALRNGLVHCVVSKPWRPNDLLMAIEVALHVHTGGHKEK